jgi:hypothetical protein
VKDLLNGAMPSAMIAVSMVAIVDKAHPTELDDQCQELGYPSLLPALTEE